MYIFVKIRELTEMGKKKNFLNQKISCVRALLRLRVWVWAEKSAVSVNIFFEKNTKLAFQFFHQMKFFGKVFLCEHT